MTGTGPRLGGALWAAVLAGWTLLGCGGASAAPAAHPEDAGTDHRLAGLPLAALVPAEAELVLWARPADALGAPAFATLVDAVFPPDARRRFADRTGLDLARIPEAVVAELPRPGEDGPPAFLALLRVPGAARAIVEAAARHRMNTVEGRWDDPFLRRVGFVGRSRRDLTALDDDTLLVVAEALDAGRAVRRRVRAVDWGPGDAPALDPADALPAAQRAHDRAPLVLVVPKPLWVPGTGELALVLAGQRRLVAWAETAAGQDGDDGIEVTIRLDGRFPESASTNFRSLVESLAATDLGGALGIPEAFPTLSIGTDPDGVSLTLTFPVSALRLGLRILFTGELAELLGDPGGGP
ncbi:MAG TPA: hypothetical protein RMF84_02105 [Polyangiaceae bacterium LLY-WYZ-14_1]|nr:hypothetical protein [Polyangiaceae bacterium LLY-WYZ-14_1]